MKAHAVLIRTESQPSEEIRTYDLQICDVKSLFFCMSSRYCAHVVLHKQTRGEDDVGGPQQVHPAHPPAEKRCGSGY